MVDTVSGAIDTFTLVTDTVNPLDSERRNNARSTFSAIFDHAVNNPRDVTLGAIDRMSDGSQIEQLRSKGQFYEAGKLETQQTFDISSTFAGISALSMLPKATSNYVQSLKLTDNSSVDVVPNRQVLGQADSRPIQMQGNVDELDINLLRLDGQAIIDDPFLGMVRSQLDNYDATVNYNYGRIGHNNFVETTHSFDGSIEIDIFKQNAFKSQDSLTTYVHESSHVVAAARGRQIGTLADEYQAFRREFLFNNGRRPTFTERRDLFEGARRVYDDVDTGDVAPLFQDLVR